VFHSFNHFFFFSGGKEGVLVVWQLDTEKKKFKPRLGSPLLYYTHSPDPSLSCVSLPACSLISLPAITWACQL